MKLLPALAIVAAFAMAACSDDTPPPVADTSNTPAAAPGGPAPNTIEYFNQVVGDRVFFATNQHTLSFTQGLVRIISKLKYVDE